MKAIEVRDQAAKMRDALMTLQGELNRDGEYMKARRVEEFRNALADDSLATLYRAIKGETGVPGIE